MNYQHLNMLGTASKKLFGKGVISENLSLLLRYSQQIFVVDKSIRLELLDDL